MWPAQQTLESISQRWVTAAAAQPVAPATGLTFLAAYPSLVPLTRAGLVASNHSCSRVAEHDTHMACSSTTCTERMPLAMSDLTKGETEP